VETWVETRFVRSGTLRRVRKKNRFKCRYQSVVRLLLRSQPVNCALSNTEDEDEEEEEKEKLPTVKSVPLSCVRHAKSNYTV
jgi:hypothetical protein